MTTLEKIENTIATANTEHEVIHNSMMEQLMPTVIAHLKEMGDSIGYDITLNRPSNEYPDVLYDILWHHLKPVVLEWLNSNRPDAWFRPMYFSKEDQDEFMNK